MEEKDLLNEDNEFLKSLENIDNEDENEDEGKGVDETKGDEKLAEDEEAQRNKNKNAEEARKRRELEAKEAEEKAKEEAKAKKEVNEEDKVTPQKQVKDLKEKYPELDLAQLDADENFQEYLQGKWTAGGDTITEIYENYLTFESRITKQAKEEVAKKFQRKEGTPSLRSKGANGGANQTNIYTVEEIKQIREKMPYMNPKDYKRIEAKYNESVAYHSKNK